MDWIAFSVTVVAQYYLTRGVTVRGNWIGCVASALWIVVNVRFEIWAGALLSSILLTQSVYALWRHYRTVSSIRP